MTFHMRISPLYTTEHNWHVCANLTEVESDLETAFHGSISALNN